MGAKERRQPRVMRDSHGRVIDYLRISVTDRCNSRCLYCMPKEGVSFIHPSRILRYEEILFLADIFLGLGIKKIRITGGEPLIRKNILFLLGELGKREGLAELVLTTNGMKLAECASSLKGAGVKRVNVSLDTLKRETFEKITGQDGIERVLGGIHAALESGLDVKVNVVAMKGVNDGEFCDFVAFGIEKGVPIRFIELMPQRYNRRFAQELFIPASEVLARIGKEYRLRPLESGRGNAESGLYEARPAVDAGERPDGDYAAACRRTTVGMISPLSDPFCRQCNRMRLMADGTLKTCLFVSGGVNLKDLLAEGIPLVKVEEEILKAVSAKPDRLRLGTDGHAVGEKEDGPVMHRVGG